MRKILGSLYQDKAHQIYYQCHQTKDPTSKRWYNEKTVNLSDKASKAVHRASPSHYAYLELVRPLFLRSDNWVAFSCFSLHLFFCTWVGRARLWLDKRHVPQQHSTCLGPHPTHDFGFSLPLSAKLAWICFLLHWWTYCPELLTGKHVGTQFIIQTVYKIAHPILGWPITVFRWPIIS